MRAKAVHSMTEGPLARSILAFSFPLMLSNVLQALFNMSDIAVVGRFAGAEALGSVGSTAILVTLFTGFLIGVGSGVNAVTARFLGARRHKDVEETVHTAFLLCLIIGLVEMALGQIFARPLLELLHTKDELIDGATLYLRIYLLGIPAAAMYNYGNGVLSAAGDTKNPLYILTIAGVVNVILNLFFVIVCRLGVAGVALASAISLYLSAGLILLSLIRSANIYALRRSALRICQDKARQLLALSLPAGAQNAIFAIANLFIQASVNSFGAVIVEGTAAATNADALVYDVMAALYTACSSFMAQNVGAGNKKRVLRSYFISLGLLLLRGCFAGRRIGAVWTGIPLLVYHGCRRGGGRHGSPDCDGLLLRLFRVYGLHHCRLARAWQKRCADGYRYPGFLRIPRDLGLYGICLFPHHHVAISFVHLFLDDYRDGGDPLFCACLPA